MINDTTKPLVIPGVFDAIGAKIAQKVGFEAMFQTGYGNALSVWKLVNELESAGAAGIFLEDQRWPKRCGHMSGKEVIRKEEYAEKLAAAVDARKSKDFIIVARTDARATQGLDDAIERGLYYKKIGADVIFVEAPK